MYYIISIDFFTNFYTNIDKLFLITKNLFSKLFSNFIRVKNIFLLFKPIIYPPPALSNVFQNLLKFFDFYFFTKLIVFCCTFVKNKLPLDITSLPHFENSLTFAPSQGSCFSKFGTNFERLRGFPTL